MCPGRIIAARGCRWGMALRLTLTALCAVLTVYAGFCLTWGIGYNTDGFQEKSGIHARPSTVETLSEVTAYFAGNLAACADDVPRDESGVCTLDRQAVLNRSASALDVLCGEFPFLRAETAVPRASPAPGALSALHFTGFYFPFTGEPNVNMDSRAAFLPATVCHGAGPPAGRHGGGGVQFHRHTGRHPVRGCGIPLLRLADGVRVSVQRPVQR